MNSQSGLKRIGVVYQGGLWEVSIEALRDEVKAVGLEEGRLRRNHGTDVAICPLPPPVFLQQVFGKGLETGSPRRPRGKVMLPRLKFRDEK